MSVPDDGTAGRNPAVPAVPSRDRLLIDLGQELRALRQELDQRAEAFDQVVEDVSMVLGPDLATLRSDLAELQGVVQGLLTDEQTEPDEEVPLNWPDLNAEQAAEAWDDLAHWVHGTLGYWHGVTRGRLPDCWPLHNPALLQLWALRLMHRASHQDGTASPLGMIEWNTRWLDAALGKVGDAIPRRLCRAVAGRPGDHLVAEHDAQRRHRAAQTAAPTPERGQPPTTAEREQRLASGVAAGPYSMPEYATPASAAGEPDDGGAAAEGEWSGTSADEEVTDPQWWNGFLSTARERDLRWRRERETHAERAGS